MAKAAAMLPPDLFEITLPMRDGDELLTAGELQQISLFDELKKTPSFDRFPGFTVLRRCRPGRVICEQGAAGETAFAILTTADVLRIRQQQLEVMENEDDGGDRISLQEEISSLEARCRELDEAEPENRQRLERVASAQLVLSLEPTRRSRGFGGWLDRLFRARPEANGSSPSRLIPVDGPSDIDSNTRHAPLFEGELFGEMSCMNRSPRSATVVATQECFLLEMVRNVMDMLHNDPKYKVRMDAVYRERVLEGHVRQLSLFGQLNDEEFARFQEHVELVEFASGEVICEEHDESDCIYLVRSGVVKVVANAWMRLLPSEFHGRDWTSLHTELAVACGENAERVPGLVAEALDEGLQAELVEGAEPSEEFNRRVLEALNAFIQDQGIPVALGKTRQAIVDALDDPDFHEIIADFPENCRNWSQVQTRICRRWILELAFPTGLPRRDETAGPRRTLAYLGRGDSLGEMSVVLDEPRNATCIAYDHPDSGFHQRIPDSRTGAVPSRVELVRIPRDVLTVAMQESERLRASINAIVEQRQQHTRDQALQAAIDPSFLRQQSPRFEQLGLIQGQQLMLVDLDRCTRCGACVDACVAAHDDGNSRLFLDGPRYENYLVPLTCRKCLDPVCMIGCPVGAINRGDSGEIAIGNWCIGCRLCADQCPYGSIQMNHLPKPVEPDEQQLQLLPEGTEVKKVIDRAVVCDLCSSVPGGSPSCVYACPHEAAMRIDARGFFFEAADFQPGASAEESRT